MITKWCLVKACFDLCFAHSAICTANNGQVTNYIISRGKDEHGNSIIKEFTEEVGLCNSEEARADCDIFSCGKPTGNVIFAELIWIICRIPSWGMIIAIGTLQPTKWGVPRRQASIW